MLQEFMRGKRDSVAILGQNSSQKFKIVINGFNSGLIFPYMLDYHTIELDFTGKKPIVAFTHSYYGEYGKKKGLLKARTELSNFFDDKETEQFNIDSIKSDLERLPNCYQETFNNEKSTARFKKIIYIIDGKEYVFASHEEQSEDYKFFTQEIFNRYPFFKLKDLNVTMLKSLFNAKIFK